MLTRRGHGKELIEGNGSARSLLLLLLLGLALGLGLKLGLGRVGRWLSSGALWCGGEEVLQ